ncbi:hypothetical protein K503DRAFT_348265 [Rhizopogon vinicolor AM-OR11-026]|uniref:Uncharacterized protein n=1 Tax=Rhizopogon vinicolor AM-OR11-026 TaxID=1314800 RepID=A0A1B7NCI0_9AGAM|nr:hypothetical protein K503DRAFT_348265 [Rhizopogon vinicolor AM-OR11-026]
MSFRLYIQSHWYSGTSHSPGRFSTRLWASKKYHGHRVLPESIMRDLTETGLGSNK